MARETDTIFAESIESTSSEYESRPACRLLDFLVTPPNCSAPLVSNWVYQLSVHSQLIPQILLRPSKFLTSLRQSPHPTLGGGSCRVLCSQQFHALIKALHPPRLNNHLKSSTRLASLRHSLAKLTHSSKIITVTLQKTAD